jgi:Trypsin-like peptidase domain
MKDLIRVVLVSALMIVAPAVFAQTPEVEGIGPQENFSDTLSKATLEMYVGRQECGYTATDTVFGPVDVWGCKFVAKPICTGTVIRREETTYLGVSTGHCVVPELYNKGYEYYVSDTVGDNPVLNKITIMKWDNSDRYDYLVFMFHSLRARPAIDMAGKDEDIPAIGTEVLNANFSLGIVKQVTEGKVLSGRITADRTDNKYMAGRYFVSIGIGPGASGSAVVDKKTHKIVGLVEAVFRGTQMATVVVPMGKTFYDFVDDDSAVPPKAAPKDEEVKFHEAPPENISAWAVIKKYIQKELKELGL